VPLKQSIPPRPLPLAAQVTDAANQPFVDLARALLKASFLFVNETERPYQSYDLTLAQMDVLSTLARTNGENISCSEIAARTLITKGGITGILDRLEARGLVKRFPSSDDRRSVLVRLSSKGIELFRKLYPELARSNRSILERAFKPQQMKDFSRLLEVLIQSIERY